MPSVSIPGWLPIGAVDIEEDKAQEALRNLQRCPVYVPLLQRSVKTAFLQASTARTGILTCSFAWHTARAYSASHGHQRSSVVHQPFALQTQTSTLHGTLAVSCIAAQLVSAFPDCITAAVQNRCYSTDELLQHVRL